MGDSVSTDNERLEKLIAEASASGGSELANYQLFTIGLTEAMGLDRPGMAAEENQFNDYVFERRVDFKHPDGSRTAGRIDCYKRGCFILEAKQSGKRAKKNHPDQLDMLPEDARQQKPGQAKRGTRQWDQVMLAARKQAEDYARALPVEHGYPPFLLIVDVGNVIEVFADFSGQGKNYAHFPDRRTYRIGMDGLRDGDVQERLRAIWTDPHALDPAKKSAEVTRDIAERLARIAKRLEGRHDAKDVAEFLMRCLFTMFAEDVELIPKHSFEKLLEELKDRPDHFVPAMEHLWGVMDAGGYEPRMMASLKRFNGSLFKKRTALPLDADGIHELWVASKRDWRDVEPAIFGTLLERALDPRERSKLGAHYTPRSYVERLVIPTIIEPLREEWETVQSSVKDLHDKGKDTAAVKLVKDFHHRLCTIRVLDPACGTGNFLYVSLELLKKLEGEILEALDALGEDAPRFAMEGETVGPRQFYGLEINPRAVPIADLVLWIGFIKWQLRTNGLSAITEPVLHAYGTIKEQDAILAYDRQDLMRDDQGRPLSRWDGVTKKLHPITGEEIPDPDAQAPLYSYANPRIADWPEVEFIVGNPPFIGGKDMRAELGDGYAEACWKARPHMPGGADFVMHFWDEAARRLARKNTKNAVSSPSGAFGDAAFGEETFGAGVSGGNPLHRFGFITTNSITQTFSRRVIEQHLKAKEPISLVFAVPDHPWLKASDKAAVRIAMTVAEKGEREGVLAEVIREGELNTDTPKVELESREGKIVSNIKLGADTTLAKPLISNSSLAHMGVKLHGKGFILSAKDLAKYPATERTFARKFLNGRDLVQRNRGSYAIDFHGLAKLAAEHTAPHLFQHLLMHVRPEREAQASRSSTLDAKQYAENWWLWGKPRDEWRNLIRGITCFIATTRTARHRTFQMLANDITIESKVVGIGVPDTAVLVILSARLHTLFAEAKGGWQGVGNDPVYQHSDTFNPFPFPACVTEDSNAELRQRLADLGERLDVFRKEQLAAHDFLTMTNMYNVLERLRELENGCSVEPLSEVERAIHEAGLISVLKDIHDEIDRATFEAYGWSDLGAKLVGKPGATLPSTHKSDEQEAAEEELLSRLVALNLERQAEERRGLVRWLRPDYQIPKLGHKVARREDGEQVEADIVVAAAAEKPKWPKETFDQIRIVKEVLAKAVAPATPNEVAATFDGRNTANRKERVDEVLRLLAETGGARTGQLHGETRYFVPR